MKNKFKLIAVSGFILLNAVFVFGQKKIITSGEHNSAYSAASQRQYEANRRIETVTETYSNGNVTNKTTTIYEKLLPNKSRYVRRVQNGDTLTETESITIDDFLYERENGGAWTKIDLSKYGTGFGSASGTPIGCRQITVEQTFLNSVSVRLFEKLDINSGEKGLTFMEEKNWISDDGFLLKVEKIEGLYLPRIETSKTVTTYEYNPTNLKIEAPVK